MKPGKRAHAQSSTLAEIIAARGATINASLTHKALRPGDSAGAWIAAWHRAPPPGLAGSGAPGGIIGVAAVPENAAIIFWIGGPFGIEKKQGGIGAEAQFVFQVCQ